MKITWMGTASLVLETKSERIAFDPFVQLLGSTNPNTIEDFLQEDTILLTHGHFDHAYFIPELIEQADPTVFCTECVVNTLEQFTQGGDNLVKIHPGDELHFGDITVKVLRGKHVVFDKKLIANTLRPDRLLRKPGNLPFLLYALRAFPEGNETVAYEIEAEGKKILLLGSLGVDMEENYPADVDLLILPYQGSSKLVQHAKEIVGFIRPKRVLLTHFDNAYPPISQDVDTKELKKMMKQEFPQVQVVKPHAGKPVYLT